MSLTKPDSTNREQIYAHPTSSKKGLLLVNLGSPLSTKVSDVRQYLREFLMDPYVIDIPYVKRFLLVNGIIAPLRAPKSAKAYREIWTAEGSPLINTTLSLGAKVSKLMGDSWTVKVAMRYQEPSMISELKAFKDMGVDDLYVLPLYPQYALSSSESVRAKLFEDLKKLSYAPRLNFKEYFYNDPGYYKTFAGVIDREIESFKPDMLIFSYHGVPERHVTKTDPTTQHCLKKENCCSVLCDANKYCYRSHCIQTTDLIRKEMTSTDLPFVNSFQSRLGRDPWIKPYTDFVAKELAEKGVKRLAVASPAFVADCLETLEEIAGELKESFVEAGGEDLRLIPSLNDADPWALAISEWYKIPADQA